MNVAFRPQALLELDEARAWYENRSPGLGFAFASDIEAVVQRIGQMPMSFPLIEGDFRRAIAKRFPYSLIYFLHDEEIVVVSCFHHRRHPDAWRANLEP